MDNPKRQSGIDVVGEIAWGTHLCLFYPGEAEFFNLATSYLAAGLADHEACVWAVSAPLTCERANQALEAKAGPLADYLASGQLIIIDGVSCYRPGGKFEAQAILDSWLEREQQALQRGFIGLRACGDTGWLDESEWAAFQTYEKQVDAGLKNCRMLALCAYPQERCSASQIFDVIANHQMGLVWREGIWEALASSEYGKLKEALEASERRFRAIYENAVEGIFQSTFAGQYLHVNPAMARIFGYESPEEMMAAVGNDIEHKVHVNPQRRADFIKVLMEAGAVNDFENQNYRKDGSIIWTHTNARMVCDPQGRPIRFEGFLTDVTERKKDEALHLLLQELMTDLGSISDLTEALNLILQAVCQIEPADCGGIYLVDEQSGEVNLAAHFNLPGQFVKAASHYTPDTPNARLVMAGKPVYGQYAELRVNSTNRELEEDLKALAVIPVMLDGRAVAALNIASHRQNDFSEKQRAAFELLAAQLGAALRRLRAEQVARDHQKNLQMLFDQLGDFLFILDPQANILVTNPAAQKALGYAADELTGQPVTFVHPPERWEEAIAIVGEMLAGRAAFCPVPLITKDGRLIPVETRVAPGKWDGRPVLLGISRDISERLQAQEALQNSEQLYRTLAETTPDLIFVVDRQDRVQYVNAVAAGYFLSTPQELVGRQRAEIFSAGVAQIQLQGLQQVFETGARVYNEILTPFSDKKAWLGTWLSPLQDAQGEIQAVMGYARDITEQKHLEQALRQSEQRFRTLATVASAGIYLTDAMGNCQYANPRWLEMSGMSPDEASGLGWLNALHSEDRQQVIEHLMATKDSITEWSGEFRFQTSQGKVIWVSGLAAPIFDPSEGESDRITGYVGVSMDITERKEMELQLRQALAEKEVLLREVHHRVKNNLATIASLLELQAHASQDPCVQSAFRESQQRIRSMTQIHEQLYRSESLACIDMEKYVSRLADELRYVYAQGETPVEVEIGQVELVMDQAIPCGLIITELVTNSLKYAFPERQTLRDRNEIARRTDAQRVEVGMHTIGDQCLLKVSDNGVGLPPGFNVQAARSLGLRLVSRLAVQLGGELHVEDAEHRPEGGVAFQIVFPIKS